MDVRHPLTDHDQDMLQLATSRELPVHILLTKADKLGRGAAGNALQAVRRKLPPDGLVTVQLFSAHSGDGVQEARGALEKLLDGKPHKRNPGWTSGSSRGKSTRYWGMTGQASGPGR